MTIKRTHIYGQPKDLDYHLPWQWRSPSKLTRILSTKPFLYSYTLYVCRWRLLLGPQLESGRARVLILYKLGNTLILNKNTIVKTLSFLHVSILVFIQENTYLSRKKNILVKQQWFELSQNNACFICIIFRLLPLNKFSYWLLYAFTTEMLPIAAYITRYHDSFNHISLTHKQRHILIYLHFVPTKSTGFNFLICGMKIDKLYSRKEKFMRLFYN